MVWPLTIQDIIDSPENMEPIQNNEIGSQAAAANHTEAVNPNEDASTFDPITANGETLEAHFVDTPLTPEIIPTGSGMPKEPTLDADTSLIDTDCEQLAGILAHQSKVMLGPLPNPVEKSRKKSATEKQLDIVMAPP